MTIRLGRRASACWCGRILIGLCLMTATAPRPADAAEKGTSFYLLGSRGPQAGMTPPEGLFFQNDTYFYSGDASRSIDIPIAGETVAGAEVTAVLDLASFLWVTPVDILGGDLALVATIPFGWQEVEGSIGPASLDDDIFTFGDPVLGTFVGWHANNFHWQTGVTVNVPIGDYREGSLANISFNRWAADVYGAATWFDPEIGLDLSSALGITFNGENPKTDYRTGTEFHWEWAITQNITDRFSAGLAGYYLDQISGDSGSGARLGDFEGRVAAIGATVGYTFQVGIVPIAARLKFFHEFDVTNRLKADTAFLTVAMPLWVPGH